VAYNKPKSTNPHDHEPRTTIRRNRIFLILGFARFLRTLFLGFARLRASSGKIIQDHHHKLPSHNFEFDKLHILAYFRKPPSKPPPNIMFSSNNNAYRFVVCVLSLALSANADTIRGALNQSEQQQRALTGPLTEDTVLLSSLGSNGSFLDPLVPSAAFTYTALGIVGLTGPLYLDASGLASNSKWAFEFPAAFTTAAQSEVIFVDNTNQKEYRASDADDSDYQEYAAKVTWLVTGPITLGASSFVPGKMTSGQTISLGATAKCGDVCANAAIVLGASANSGSLTGDAAITVGAGSTCGAITAGAAITIGAGSYITSLKAAAATTVGAAVVCSKDTPVVGQAWTECTARAIGSVAANKLRCPDLVLLDL
jgi:hypothetical protein